MRQVFIRSLFASIGVHSRLNCIDPAKPLNPCQSVRSVVKLRLDVNRRADLHELGQVLGIPIG